MTNDIKFIWDNLKLNSGLHTIREPISVAGLNCFVGRIGAYNAKMFQIEIDNSISVPKNYLKRFYGVEIRIIDNTIKKKDVTIILSDNDLFDVFILFIKDLMNGLELISEENDVILILNKRVDYWGKLFAQIKGKLLSKEKQRGLYGELIFLNTLLDQSSDFEKTIVSWSGPEGGNQDFSIGSNAVELKSSKSSNQSVNVSSELQLDWTVFDNLFLYVIHLDEVNNGKSTLSHLIQEIKEKISKTPFLLNLFQDKLNHVGITEGEEKYYDELGYVVRSQIAFKVQDGFPALTVSILNNEAIHKVKYQIDLIACKPFEVEIEGVINKMK